MQPEMNLFSLLLENCWRFYLIQRYKRINFVSIKLFLFAYTNDSYVEYFKIKYLQKCPHKVQQVTKIRKTYKKKKQKPIVLV